MASNASIFGMKIAKSLLYNELGNCNFLLRVRKLLKTEVFRSSLKAKTVLLLAWGIENLRKGVNKLCELIRMNFI
jgi:hypothetical protein